MKTETGPERSDIQPVVSNVLDILTPERFADWYQERQYKNNIANGTPFFNGPSIIPDVKRHSPSKLVQCHRKVFYQQHNAPAEKEDPEGIFWFGSKFEEDVILPFLDQSITTGDTYVRNSIWVDQTIETDIRDLRIKGSTDPVIVDSESIPILPTEVKTTSSVANLRAPRRHHRAQLHAYLSGLSEKYDCNLEEGVLIYAGRKSFNLKVFHVPFDETFWHDVVIEWAKDHTQYRIDEELPSAEPEFDWECEYCSYRERCGQGEKEFSEQEPAGLLPVYANYPRKKVIEYLESDNSRKLTPTLANVYSDLVEQYGAYDWHCSNCNSDFEWYSIEQRYTSGAPPKCPECSENGDTRNWLRGPTPEEQHKRRSR